MRSNRGIRLFKGRKRGMVRTMDIHWKDVRCVFFPRNFYEKYRYLGAVPMREDGAMFKAMYPLVLAMDHIAKPKGCPRWFLRFLHLFGSDNSIVRVRNRRLHNLATKLTKGLLIWDYKTKWSNYDLRISVSGPEHIQELASAIEARFYKTGRQEELVKEIKKLDPQARIVYGSVSRLEDQLAELEEKLNTK